MQFISFSDLYGRIEEFLDGRCKLLTAIATVNQEIDNRQQFVFVLPGHSDRASSISDISGCHQDGMRQAERVNVNVTFNAGYLLSGVIAFFSRRVGVLDALSISNT